MNRKKLTRKWRDALDDEAVLDAVRRAVEAWPRLPLTLVLLVALDVWHGLSREQQAEAIALAAGVDPDEAAADAADAEQQGGRS